MYKPELEMEPRDRRLERKWAAVRSLLDSAAERSREFKSRLARAGIKAREVRSFADFAHIPPLRKREIIELQAEHGPQWLLGCGLGELRRVYQSPGPIFDPEGAGHDYWGWTEGFWAAGFRPGDLVQMTFSYHLTPAGLMLEEPLREIGCAVIPAGPGNTEVQIELMTRLPVTGFVGMASYLKVIGHKAVQAGFDLRRDFHLRTAFVAAEKLTEALRSEVEQAFGMTVRQGYGTADVGAIAYECGELGGMHVTSRCWVEVCDPETGLPLPAGEVGEVVVTPFTADYPLIRLATGDLSFFKTEPCACGRTSVKLGGVLGRADDTAKVKGQFIYPSQAVEVMAAFPAIKAWQLAVSNPGGRDALTARLAVDRDLDQEAFVRAFQKRLKLRPAVELLAPGDLAPDSPRLVDLRSFQDAG
ncbi:MAG: AMP-binding protein [Desulfovibrionaceae bacterium]|nr:AMP-binding protein [Desulfovibrionaceae bacterium]MDD4952738.1 AMP-binding protein [Desulfovibrionaceae bacterium]